MARKKSQVNSPAKAPAKAPHKAPTKVPPQPAHNDRESPQPEDPATPPPALPIPGTQRNYRITTPGGLQHFIDEAVPAVVLNTVNAVLGQVDEDAKGPVTHRVARMAVEELYVCLPHVLHQWRNDETFLIEVIARAIAPESEWREKLQEYVALAAEAQRHAESIARRSKTRTDTTSCEEESSSTTTEEEVIVPKRTTAREGPTRAATACHACRQKLTKCICPQRIPKKEARRKPTGVDASKRPPVPPRPVYEMETSEGEPEQKNGPHRRHNIDVASASFVMNPALWTNEMTHEEFLWLRSEFREMYVNIHQKGSVHHGTAEAVSQAIFVGMQYGATESYKVIIRLLERLRAVALTPGIRQAQLDQIQALIPSITDDVPPEYVKAREEQAKIAAKLLEEKERSRNRGYAPQPYGRGRGSPNFGGRGANSSGFVPNNAPAPYQGNQYRPPFTNTTFSNQPRGRGNRGQ